MAATLSWKPAYEDEEEEDSGPVIPEGVNAIDPSTITMGEAIGVGAMGTVRAKGGNSLCGCHGIYLSASQPHMHLSPSRVSPSRSTLPK